LTGRLTNSFVGICGFLSLVAALTWMVRTPTVCKARD
jgi:hypothetical protein